MNLWVELGFRNNALSTLVLTTTVLLVFSFTATASCQLLDEDSRTEAYSRCTIQLSRQDDAVETKDFYDLRVIIASRIRAEGVLPNPAWSGPIITYVYVFLPSYASSISASPPQNLFLLAFQSQVSRFEPEIEQSGGFVRVHWELSSERFGFAGSWSFIDQLDYSIRFVVPQNASVTVYAHVQNVFYTYQVVYYSQLADEKTYFLKVRNADEVTALPETLETSAPILIFDASGINLIIASVFSVVSFWHFKRYRQHSPRKTGVNEQRISEADYSARHARTWGITILAAAIAFVGILAIVVGSIQLSYDASFAISLLAGGLASTLTVHGLFWVKPWAWYAAVGLMIIEIIDYFLLFTTPTTLTIPIAPFILIYLIAIRHRFF